MNYSSSYKVVIHITYLVWVCAWCNKNDYPQLGDNERYTHGICDKHLHEICF